MISQVAQTIAAQIGNRAFLMLGAKQLVADEEALRFRIGSNPKGVNSVTVLYDRSRDAYTVQFYKVKKWDFTMIKSVETVYADSLHQVIESNTGLYLSL